MPTPTWLTVRPALPAIVAIALAAVAAPSLATTIRHEDHQLTWGNATLPSGSQYGTTVGLAAEGPQAHVGAPPERSRSLFRFEDGAWERDFDSTGGGDDPTLVACSNSREADTSVLAVTRHIGGTYRVGPARLVVPYISGIEGGHVRAVANLGNVIALGQPDYNGGSGRILIYEFLTNDWELTGELVGPSGSRLGSSLALIGPTLLAAGLPGLGDNGAVQIYAHVGDWFPYQFIDSPFCCSSDAQFGYSIAAMGQWLAIGAPGFDRPLIGGGIVPNTGTVAMYLVTEFTWELAAYARPSEATEDDEYGSSVALRSVGELGGVLLAGSAYDEISATNQGSAYVWWLAGGVWEAKWRLAAAAGGAQDRLGTSVALGPRGALVGAPGATANGVDDQGAAYFFAGVVPLFYDGFESGDTEAWSSASP